MKKQTVKTMDLWHGSTVIVASPIYGYGKDTNDYGRGFYCTENVEMAKEWACPRNQDGFANHYELNMDGLQTLDLNQPPFHIMNWLAVLISNRKVNLSLVLAKTAASYIIEHYNVDLSPYDLVRGYRADDSYFAFVRSFVSNEISLQQLSEAMQLGRLGEQIMLRSRKAFDQFTFIEYEIAHSSEYSLKRQRRANHAQQDFERLASTPDLQGIYMQDILRGKVNNDELRL